MEHTSDTQADKDQPQQSQSPTSTESTFGTHAPAHQILQLQRLIGNHAVNRMLIQRDPQPVTQPQIQLVHPQVVLWEDRGNQTRVYDLSSRDLRLGQYQDMTGRCQIRFGVRFNGQYAYYMVTWHIRFEMASNALIVDGGTVQRQGGRDPSGIQVASSQGDNTLSVQITAQKESFGVVELLEVGFFDQTTGYVNPPPQGN